MAKKIDPKAKAKKQKIYTAVGGVFSSACSRSRCRGR